MSGELKGNVHFVGSVCLPDEHSTFRTLCGALPSNLKRIPDGESGKRQNFVIFQWHVFDKCPWVQAKLPPGSDDELQDILLRSSPSPVRLLPVEYDDFAIASYDKFCKLREEGRIPPGVRFQVSLPTPVNVLGNLVKPAWRAEVEPLYEQALLDALRRIQNHIPANDLAVQWDLASEFAFLEGAASVPIEWFAPVKEGLVERVLKVAGAVDEDVELGFHLCYGDFGHKHFIEPHDMALLVEVGNSILTGVRRHVNWIHMPVPKDRVDAAYFSPLDQLRLGGTELYLGLLHAGDESGTRARIEAGSKFIASFGIATECGLGRTSKSDFESIIQIAQRIAGSRRS